MRHPSIFIAGQDGFIGKRLTQFIQKKLPAVELNGSCAADLNLAASDAWKALAERLSNSTHFIVLAGIKRQAGDAYETFQSNIQIAASVARAIECAKPRRVLFFSSAAVYGEETSNTSTAEATPVNPVSFYGIAKFASERVLENAARNAESSLLCIRPPLIYGPEDTTDSYGPVGFIRSHLKRKPITLWGDGSELREFLYVDDCCHLVQKLLDHTLEGVLNLASGKSHSFLDVISVLEKVSNSKVDFFTRPRTKAKADNGFDPSILRSIFPDFQFTNLEEGIRKTFEYESRHIPLAL